MEHAMLISPLLRFLLLTAIAAASFSHAIAADPKEKPSRWESAIRKFEQQDEKKSPPKKGILFIGSSSIRMWKLDDHFAELPVINRGFGGSQIADSIQFADRILLPYEPRIVVLYAGDNDVAAGKTPERVLADYRLFVKTVHDRLPKTRIVFIAIKPSIARWRLVEKMRKANSLIRAVTKEDERLSFVDIDTPMIGDDGQPRKDLFLKDGLHLNADGYKLWASLVKPHLQ